MTELMEKENETEFLKHKHTDDSVCDDDDEKLGKKQPSYI